MYDRKQKTLQQEKIDHTFIEKVLNVVKERVDHSKREVNKLDRIKIGLFSNIDTCFFDINF